MEKSNSTSDKFKCFECPARPHSPFSKLDMQQSSAVDAIRQFKPVSQGIELSTCNKVGESFYCVRKGNFALNYGHAQKAGTVHIGGPGELIGYMMPNAYTARALEDMEICTINTAAFLELQKTSAEFSNGIINSLIKTIAQKDERISGLEDHSVKNKVASALIGLTKKFGTSSEYGTLINVKLDRKTLAKLSGTVIESLARTLTELEQHKIIHRQGRKIHVVDQRKLVFVAKN